MNLIKLGGMTLFAVMSASLCFSQATNSTGTVKAFQMPCPSAVKLTGQVACYKATVSCPDLPNIQAQVAVLEPTKASIGTVLYGTGGLGNNWFNNVTYGTATMEKLSQDGYRGVEYVWPSTGWQGDANGTGVRAAACRYATLAHWVSQTFVTTATPLCATGNSAGAFQIGTALAHYQAGDYITDAELTSGPPFTRVDYACINDPPAAKDPCSGAENTLGVLPAASSKFIDPAYGDNRCSSAYYTHDPTHEQQFLDDSVTSPDALLKYPGTSVYFILGGMDGSSAPRQAMLYKSALEANGVATGMTCVADAPHVIESVADGAAAVVNGILAHCK